MIRDLQKRLALLERQYSQTMEGCEQRGRDLQASLEKTQAQAHDEAYRTQYF